MRGFEAEDFAWSVVECVLDGGQLLVANVAQVHALGKELADEAIGLLIEAALSGAVRVAEEDVHIQFGAERPVQRHLRALIVGHGFAQALGDGFKPALEADRKSVV